MKRIMALFITSSLFVIGLVGCSSGVSQEDIETLQKQVDNLLQENQQLKEATEASTSQVLIGNSNSTTLPITFDAFHNIQSGMEYGDVVNLVGDYGITVAKVRKNSDNVLTTMKWNAYDAKEDYLNTETTFVYCQFENSKLIKKWADLEFIYWDFSKITIEQFKNAYPNAGEDEFPNFINGLIEERYFMSTEERFKLCRIPSSKWYRQNRFALGDPAVDEAETPSNEAWESIKETILNTVR